MKKAVSKRIKVSKSGKLLRRQVAVDHFRSKKTGTKIQSKRNQRTIAKGYEKQIKGYLTSK
jgi:ribosomal protein L35